MTAQRRTCRPHATPHSSGPERAAPPSWSRATRSYWACRHTHTHALTGPADTHTHTVLLGLQGHTHTHPFTGPAGTHTHTPSYWACRDTHTHTLLLALQEHTPTHPYTGPSSTHTHTPSQRVWKNTTLNTSRVNQHGPPHCLS